MNNRNENENEFNIKQRPMKISGSMEIPAGRYNSDITVSGSASSDGDIECAFFKCSGSVHLHGNLVAREGVKATGSFEIDGTLQTDESAKFSSSTQIKGNVIVGESLSSSSAFECEGRLSVDDHAKFSSSAEIGKEVIVGSLLVSSAFETGGLLNSDGDAKFSSSSQINGDTIVGGQLKVSGHFEGNGQLQVDEDAKFSSNASIRGNVIVGGYLHCTGNFESEGKVLAENGAKFTGSAQIKDSLLAGNDVDITGRIVIGENIEANNIYIGVNRTGMKLHRETHASKIHGSLLAKHEIDIEDVHIDRDVRAERIYLGPNTKVFGTVYYSDEFRADPKAEYVRAQQISEDEV